MANVMEVARFFIELANEQAEHYDEEGLSNMGLNKLLYFAQGASYARFGKPLFDADFEAWDHGPVVPSIYQNYKSFGNTTLRDFPPSENAFTDSEYDLLYDVARDYMKYTAAQLRKMSHEPGGPWDLVYVPNQLHISITKESIKRHFCSKPAGKSLHDVLTNSKHFKKIVPKRDQDGVAVIPAEYSADWE